MGWLIAAALLVATGLTVNAKPWVSIQDQEQGIIRLLTTGFSSSEVSGPAGQYRLVATRPSRDEQVTLQLSRESGELVEEFVMPQDKVDWTRLVELESGSYMLTVNGHPDWVCHITIQ